MGRPRAADPEGLDHVADLHVRQHQPGEPELLARCARWCRPPSSRPRPLPPRARRHDDGSPDLHQDHLTEVVEEHDVQPDDDADRRRWGRRRPQRLLTRSSAPVSARSSNKPPDSRSGGLSRRWAVSPPRRVQRGRTASACGPLGPWVTSNSTRCASSSDAVAVGLDRGVVHEDVGTAAVLRDESETLLGVEPLHGALCHLGNYFFLSGRGRAHLAHVRLPSCPDGRRSGPETRKPATSLQRADFFDERGTATATGDNLAETMPRVAASE